MVISCRNVTYIPADIYIALKQRRIDVDATSVTLHRRRYDAASVKCINWDKVHARLWKVKENKIAKKKNKNKLFEKGFFKCIIDIFFAAISVRYYSLNVQTS